MAQAILDQVMNQLDALKPEELQQLEDALRERLRPATEEEKEAAFDQVMLTAGLFSHIPSPRDPSKAERPRIEVQGEPVSATTIQEREAPVSEEEKKAAFHRSMLAAGLLTRIPRPRDPSKAERPLITVQGEPVSETIIRERR